MNRKSSLLLLVTTLALALSGCAGRDAAVKAVTPGDLGLLRHDGPLGDVYFRPFDLSQVKLEGDHGEGPVAEDNKTRWFPRVVAGAQRFFDENRDAGGKAVAGEPPPGALVVDGTYRFSKNVGGGKRFWLGAASGKSWNRADVRISRDGKLVYAATIEGRYLDRGVSWPYETFAVNEELGRAIAEVLWKLQRGLPVGTR